MTARFLHFITGETALAFPFGKSKTAAQSRAVAQNMRDI
ncbi:hypothetical protein Rsw2DRAFT_2619 [Rhodobacter ferrooxidans]|uniref:Uncharacterized protein n=1 Tax=Rhodobacter ferrooxidans TaxID=371731 RepID=C8S3J1_9RHOB|nr:hypothetical protein Rsw2DRAFT_2619 [Rhodobacter sp. SW2]